MTMRKLFCLLIVLALLLPAAAFAEPKVLEDGVITELFDGDLIDLDGDGAAEKIGYSVTENPNDGTSSFRLTIGKTQLDGDGDWLTGRLHALRLPGHASEDILLFISDYGMSDDDVSYIFSYYQGKISRVGLVETMPWDMSVSGPNTLAGRVRGSILCTWWRPCEYVFGITNGMSDEGEWIGRRVASVEEIPKSEYPMGFYVTVNRTITLQISRTNSGIARKIPAGSKVTIVATDDIEWIYIMPVERDWNWDYAGGWLRLDDYGYSATVNGESVETMELFSGLLFAD